MTVPLTDREVLELLYEELDGDNWGDELVGEVGEDWWFSENWLTDKPLDEWYRVSTDADGRVVRLELSYNGLTGEIPPELGDLSDLLSLELSYNSLTGEVPPELGDLSNLRHLYLSDNSLTGEIPPELGNLSNLEDLDLSYNSLTGEIPPDFLDLSLRWFYWDGNEGLCAPSTSEFDDWLDRRSWRGPRCK